MIGANNSIKTSLIIITIIVLFLSIFSFVVFGQSEISFSVFDNFDIPINNSSISFAVDGTYEKVSLENGIWNFINLQMNNSQNDEKLNLKVSVRNCIMTISSIQIYNRTFGNEIARRLRIRYNIVGNGIQVFDLGFDSKKGEWDIKVNDDYIAENRGWTLSSDGIVTVTNAKGNVILSYYGVPDSNFNQSFFNQHSIVIISSLIAIVVVIFSIAINIRKKRTKILNEKHV